MKEESPEVDMLIEMVRQRPYLIDIKDPLYKDTAAKEQAWACLGSQLNVTGEEAKRQWILIRDNFQRRHKKIMDRPSLAGSNFKRTWPQYEKMLWYLKYANKNRSRFGSKSHNRQEDTGSRHCGDAYPHHSQLLFPESSFACTSPAQSENGQVIVEVELSESDANAIANGNPAGLAVQRQNHNPSLNPQGNPYLRTVRTDENKTITTMTNMPPVPRVFYDKSPNKDDPSENSVELAEEYFAKAVMYELRRIPLSTRMECKMEIMKVLKHFQDRSNQF